MLPLHSGAGWTVVEGATHTHTYILPLCLSDHWAFLGSLLSVADVQDRGGEPFVCQGPFGYL